ncbi:hypothetical protein GWK47_055175 [Chionoecetes opilio]|uniref:Uncharacterized protein n=1 Tax=Chionoecetes opilio TaxID=41210 RepID=A0A8J4Y3W0_CHIOP|nr:hypothetical protein GWK47_055175 [Chionoecetes opilio]
MTTPYPLLKSDGTGPTKNKEKGPRSVRRFKTTSSMSRTWLLSHSPGKPQATTRTALPGTPQMIVPFSRAETSLVPFPSALHKNVEPNGTATQLHLPVIQTFKGVL